MILYLLFSNFPVKLICKKPGTVEINIPMVKDSIALRTTCCLMCAEKTGGFNLVN